jgi:hypothetical protein
MRRRYILKDGELVEVSDDYDNSRRVNTDAILWNDRLYQDSGDSRFSSRAAHREYMRQNGLTTVDDFKDYFKNTEKSRIAMREGKDPRHHADVKNDVIETVRRFDANRRR